MAKKLILLFSLSITFPLTIYALEDLAAFHLRPQMTITGYIGDESLLQEQLRLPFYSDPMKSHYAIIEGAATKTNPSWLAGLGVGYRMVADNAHVMGFYLIADYENSEHNHGLWMANPGWEIFGELWGFHANAYLVSSKHWIEKDGWENERKIYRYVHQIGHEYRDHRYTQYANTGNGGDLEIDRVFPQCKDSKASAGIYHFNIEHDHGINGIFFSLEYPINQNVAIKLYETYDNNKKNTLLAGLKVNFGGFSADEKKRFGISSRLLDPIEHGKELYSTLPMKMTFADHGKEETLFDHVWYFKADANVKEEGDGTYEHPYSDFDAEKFDQIKNDAKGSKYADLFFSPGFYSLKSFSNARLVLPANYNLWGRDEDYTRSAEGSMRATFYGGIDLFYGDNTLESLKLYNVGGAQKEGLRIGKKNSQAIDDINLNNLIIGAENMNDGYETGMYLENAQNVNLNKSNVYGYTENGKHFPCAIQILKNSELNLIDDNYIVGKVKDKDHQSLMVSYGIAMGQSTLNINGDKNRISAYAQNVHAAKNRLDQIGGGIGIGAYWSAININGDGNAIYAEGKNLSANTGWGIDAENSHININGDKNIILGASQKTNTASAAGIHSDLSMITINGNENTISGSSQGEIIAEAHGMDSFADIVIINGNKNIISGKGYATNGGKGFGILSYESILIFNTSGNFIAADASATAYGIYACGDGLIKIPFATSFLVGKKMTPAKDAYGIYLGSSFSPDRLDIKNCNFELPVVGYGIYNDTGIAFTNKQYEELKNYNTFYGGIDDVSERMGFENKI